jgi:4'-phosphopantetheinyl transferase
MRAPRLQPGEIHLWRIPLDLAARTIEEHSRSLSPAERLRAEQFAGPVQQARFITSRGILRRLLSAYTAIPAADLRIVTSPTGKPALAQQGFQTIDFNVAHSDGLALIGFSSGGPVGVDVERVRPGLALDQIGAMFFPDAVSAGIRTLPAAERPAAFFGCWTHREAYLKATGIGLAPEMNLAARERPVLPPCCLPPRGGTGRRWQCTPVAVARGYVGHVVWPAGRRQPAYWQWPTD